MMRLGAGLVTVVAAAAAVAGCGGDGGVSSVEVSVTDVVDGDTLDVRLPDGVERVRLPQVDTPERGECGFEVASAGLEQAASGVVVLVPTSDGPDRGPYGRLLRAVESDGADVGELLLEAGLARWSSEYADEDPGLAVVYEAAEESARAAGRGLWSLCGWR